jgi:protein-disulfide isomerase
LQIKSLKLQANDATLGMRMQDIERDIAPYLQKWIRLPLDENEVNWKEHINASQAEKILNAKKFSPFFLVKQETIRDRIHSTMTFNPAKRTTFNTEILKLVKPKNRPNVRKILRSIDVSFETILETFITGSLNATNTTITLQSKKGQPTPFRVDITSSMNIIQYFTPVLPPKESRTIPEVLNTVLSFEQKNSPVQVDPSPPSESMNTPATADDDLMLGQSSAPITLIEFADAQCPFCQRWQTEVFPSIKKNYIDTGKVKFVYRDFPLDFHPAALPFALAMECAHEQGNAQGWFFHDLVFTESVDSQTFSNVDIKKLAANVKTLNQSKFGQCLDTQKYLQEIKKDIADAKASGISGTPGFWILGPNGKSQKISGAQPYSKFQKVIDEMLK